MKAALWLIWRNALSIMLGAMAMLLAVAFASTIATRALEAYDREHPVWVEPAVRIVAAEPGAVTVDVHASKVRPCRFLRLHAQAENAAGFARDARIERVDQPMVGRTKPLGLQQLGVFRISLPASSAAAAIYVENACEGRTVVSELPIPIHAPVQAQTVTPK